MSDQLPLPVAYSPHSIATHHSAMAAIEAARTRATKSAQYLRLLDEAGTNGLSDHEVSRMTGWPLSTVCSTRNGAFPLVWPADRDAPSPFNAALKVTCWRLASDEEVQANRQKRSDSLLATG